MTDPKRGAKNTTAGESSGDNVDSSGGRETEVSPKSDRWAELDEVYGGNSTTQAGADEGANQWSRRGTLPRYQPPKDVEEVSPKASGSHGPRYKVPTDIESGAQRAVDTSPLSFEQTDITPAGGVPVVGVPNTANRLKTDGAADGAGKRRSGSPNATSAEHEQVDTSPFRFERSERKAESGDHGTVDTSPFRFPRHETTPIGRSRAGGSNNPNNRPTLVAGEFPLPPKASETEADRLSRADTDDHSSSAESSGAAVLETADGLPEELDDSGPIVEFLDEDEEELFELDPLPAPLERDNEARLPELEPIALSAADPGRTMQGLEALSPFKRQRNSSGVHSAQTVELPTIAEAAKDLEGFQKYLERLSSVRPGPGGPGQLEARSVAHNVARMGDVRLRANTSLVHEDGSVRPARRATELAPAVVEILAAAQGCPVLLVGADGSGKSHTCASLASALADTCLLSSDSLNAFDGLTVALAANGLPVPFVVDLASVATLGPTRPSELLTALEQLGNSPPSIFHHDGPVIVVADNLDTALALGVEDYDPFAILKELLESRPSWRALVATRPLGPGHLSNFGRYGAPVHVVEISSMRDEQVGSFVEGWRKTQQAGPSRADVVGPIPAAITGSPRLLQILMGQWETIGRSLCKSAEKTVSGVCGLLLDSICQTIEDRTGAGNIRRDLQTLAEVASGIGRGALSLEDVQYLVTEGFLRNELVTIISTGVVEVRLAKGDRTAAELTFSHSLLQEILLAEQIVHDMVRTGLAGNLSARTRELPYTEALSPYNERQVLRTIEVADHHVRSLPSHLLGDLLKSLESWVQDALSADLQPATSHFPRFLGVAYLVSATVRRVCPDNQVQGTRLDQATEERMATLLDGAGEISLREAVMADWVVIQTARPSTGKWSSAKSE